MPGLGLIVRQLCVVLEPGTGSSPHHLLLLLEPGGELRVEPQQLHILAPVKTEVLNKVEEIRSAILDRFPNNLSHPIEEMMMFDVIVTLAILFGEKRHSGLLSGR